MMRTAALALMLIWSIAQVGRADEAREVIFPPDTPGVIDVTKPPYNAKGDGVTDDTEAINAALRDYNAGSSEDRFMSWTIYLPEGTYLVSDTLVPLNREDPSKTECGVRITGAGVDRTIIRLKDDASGFDRQKYVLRTGNANGAQPNAGYNNYIQHLTVDVGADNPGAVGVRFDVANCGSMEHVRIVSSDPQHAGRAGLGFYGVAGQGFVKGLEVEGFEHGIYFDNASVNNLVLEHIRLSGQRFAGIFNHSKNILIRGLISDNEVPAIRTRSSFAATFLLEATLEGPGEGPAIEMEKAGFLYARDVKTSGYTTTVATGEGAQKPDVTSASIDEWWSHDAPYQTRPMASLRLPIKETPEYYNADLDQWASVMAFGATPDDDSDDDAPAIQRAIDSGKAVIYFPRGQYTLASEVLVRGPVRKIDFLFSNLAKAPDSSGGIRVVDTESDVVVLENVTGDLPIVHDSPNATAIRNKAHIGPMTTGDNARGELFIENAGPHSTIRVGKGVNAWLRSINRERPGFLNDGGTVWYFGDNIERMYNKPQGHNELNPIRTTNAGSTELIGGALDALSVVHEYEEGALIESEDATISATYAGEMRNRHQGRDVPWGSWPLHLRDVHEGQAIEITEDEVLIFDNGSAARRFVVPLYSSPRQQAPNAASRR